MLDFSRRCSLAIALAIAFFAGGFASAATPRRKSPKPKTPAKAPAVPNGARRKPDQPPGPEKPYTGPPPTAVAHPVRTPPLKKMKVIPPPARGEDEDLFE